jgi:glucose/arabinose dehydrogenase
VEQAGIIRAFGNSKNTSTSTVFLDITDRVLFGGEQGLLGLAFHPDYSTNNYLYVDYVAANPRRTIIARYTVNTSNPNVADKTSEFKILEIAQPYSNHKGGQIAFGSDGYLYIAMGDGGGAGDPQGNGQNRSTLLGKILRIDVNKSSIGGGYGIPAGNPFAGNSLGYREEIYAYGFRNPWRFSFDSAGKLWVGDVGQDRQEEIDLVEKGDNYGWNIMEGTLPYNPSSGGNQTGLESPVYEYNHTLGGAITGGYVYNGLASPLAGYYVYGDYVSGRIWALSPSYENYLLVDSKLPISSFGIDGNNNLYICSLDGRIYELNIAVVTENSPAMIIAVFIIVSSTLVTVTRKRALCGSKV